MYVRRLIGVVIGALLVVSCSSSGKSPVETAQAKVTKAQSDQTQAEADLQKAKSQFCADAKDYVTVLDRYGKLFDTSAATVGDVKTGGADLEEPQASVLSSATQVQNANDDVAKAKQALADAEAVLAAAQASASSSPAPSTTAASTTTSTLVSPATVDRVKKAEADLTAALQGVSDSTPLVQATVQVNSAAFALQVVWLQTLNEAGCLTDEQQQKAAAAVVDYTVAVQTALQLTGHYNGEIDGVYGPGTVEAVQALQTAAGLPPTGWVDRATAAALDTAVVALGGAAATHALVYTSAVQSTLKLAGYWTGPVDGQWTPELTTALMNFQTALGVPPSGMVDAATLAALDQAIAQATSPATSTTTTPSTTSTTTEASSASSN